MAIIKRDADPLRMLGVLVGNVAGHPQHGDSQAIRTSQLVWVDRYRQWAVTWNRAYRLGERAGDAFDSKSEGVGA
jgi:hypothetical protein